MSPYLPFLVELMKYAFSKRNFKSKTTVVAAPAAVATVALAANSDGSLESLLMNLASALIAVGLFFYKGK